MEYLTENEAIRQAMLTEQSEWLEEADKADSFTQIAIAKVIAMAFGKAAAKYKTKETKDRGDIIGTRSWLDELAEAPSLSPQGGGSGGSGGSSEEPDSSSAGTYS